MKNFKNLLGIIVLLIALTALIFSAKLNSIFQSSYGIETNEEGFNFNLKKATGGNFQLSEVKGSLIYLYFGYMNCPNLCPLRMSNLLELSKKISRKDVRFIYITIDPTQDTESNLKLFSDQLGENFTVLYADSETIKDITRKYKIFYEKLEDDQWNHSDKLYLLDRHLNIRLIYLTSQKDIAKMEEDLARF